MKYIIKKMLPAALMLFAVKSAKGQDKVKSEKDSIRFNATSLYCNPSIPGKGRSKGIVAEYEAMTPYNMQCKVNNSEEIQSVGRVSQTRRALFSVKVPLVNKPGFQMVLGLKYSDEEIQFVRANEINNPFLRSIEDKSLRNFGGALYMMKPFKGRTFIGVKAGATLAGDFDGGNLLKSNFLRMNFTPLFGWKKSENTVIGAGFSLNNSFGRVRVLPVVSYLHTFNSKWGVEATLPSDIRVRHNISEKCIVYGSVAMDGGNYRIYLKDEAFKHVSYELNRMEVRAQIMLEREVYDFLWFGLSGGVRQNISFKLQEIDSRQAVATNTLQNAGFINMSLFLVPPKKHKKA